MIARVDEESMHSQVLDITTIYLVGPWRVRNELLSSFLQEKIGAECLIVNTIRDLPVPTDESGYSPRLVLLDCLGKDPASATQNQYSAPRQYPYCYPASLGRARLGECGAVGRSPSRVSACKVVLHQSRHSSDRLR